MNKPKNIETAWKQIDRRAKWYGMTRKEYIDAFFNRFGQHDDLKTELAIERILDDEKSILERMV
jgi:hypothetical protein